MGLFSSLEEKWKENKNISYDDLQKKYLTDFEKGQVNKANQLAEGLVQSVLELGTKAGWTKQETLDKFNQKLRSQSNKLDYDNKVLGAAGELVGELTIAAPASTLGWFGSGGKLAQIYKQGLFGGVWSYFTTPTSVMADQDKRIEEAQKSALFSAGATAALGVIGRPIEKLTNFDFKQNIQAVKDASASLGISPKLLGDFTGDEARRAAEALNKSRGGGVLDKLKENVNELNKAGGDLEKMYTKGAIYSGEAGKNVAAAVQTNYKNVSKEGNKLFKNLDVLVEENNLTKINPESTKVALSNALDEYSELFKTLERPDIESKLVKMAGKVGKEEVIRPAGLILDESGKPIIQEVKGPAEFTFQEIRKTREALSDAYLRAKQLNKFTSKEAVKINEILGAMDQDIERWGASASNNANVADSWKKARDYWRGNVVPLRDADLAIMQLKDPNSGELKADVSKLINKIVSVESPVQEGANRAAKLISKVLPEDVKQDVTASIFNSARQKATDASGNFDPMKFSSFIQQRKLNLQPFVEDNIDTMLNKYSFLSQQLTRGSTGASQSLDEAATTALRIGFGASMGGGTGAALAAVPINRLMEAVSRAAFDTKAGRAIMLSAQSIDDLRPLVTGGVLAAEKEAAGVKDYATPEWEIPAELKQIESVSPKYSLPPELMNENINNINKIIDEESEKLGISQHSNVLKNIARAESSFNQSSISPKGAIGVMQLMPGTASELGVNPENLDENVRGGVRYWAQQLNKFNDPVLATAAYNAGPKSVIDAGYKVPEFAETKNYVKSIFGDSLPALPVFGIKEKE